jgi:hypothetical protein
MRSAFGATRVGERVVVDANRIDFALHVAAAFSPEIIRA